MREIPADQEGAVNRSIAYLKENQVAHFANEIIQGLLCLDPQIDIKRGRSVGKVLRRQRLQISSHQVERYIANTLRLFLHTPLNTDHSPDVPTLVFTGEHDTFTKPLYCKEIANSFPRAAFTTIKGADHLCHMEAFDWVAQLAHASSSANP